MREAGIALVMAIGILSTVGIGGLASASPALAALVVLSMLAGIALLTWRRPRTV